MSQSFDVTVVEIPDCTLVGLFVETTMQNASTDCSHLWEKEFMPRMPELSFQPGNAFQGATFGVSIMTSEEGKFIYWAAAPLPEGVEVPKGMSTLELQGGKYARCTIPSLEQLSEAYMYLYTTWPQSCEEYTVSYMAPCFERYDEKYLQNGSLEVYAPLVAR